MTSVFLNPPHSSFSDLVEQKEDQKLKLFINSQYNEASSSLSSPTAYNFFNSSTQDQRGGCEVIGSQQRDQKAVIDIFSISTSQNLHICQRDREDNIGDPDHEYNNKSMNNNGSVKYWMSSKMRLMEKMSNPETCATSTDDKGEKTAHKVLQYSPRQDNSGQAKFNLSQSNRTTVRVCSDCNTTSTPLWRSGPRGPKSLCNACGIRQRKARRAMAEAAAAANGLVVAADSTSTAAPNYTPTKGSAASTSYYKTTQYHINKEKKSRGNHISHYKNKLKLKLLETKNDNINDKHCLNKFSFGLNVDNCSAFSGVFPKDVAEAAVLLMELSCGFVHS
ncbi:Putative GATA transcription factor 22 [Morus notabilis]|uniref:Putative GATA transcription factor 22 n=1 Tax=Morus notabilis TaxID=981085 RepID=W9RRY8_9ROSA|nr:putative GATA transcription factor 22 [Morus notabilis]EXB66867.1 Putative GATA transcription factor 22 [Morus notabilis]